MNPSTYFSKVNPFAKIVVLLYFPVQKFQMPVFKNSSNPSYDSSYAKILDFFCLYTKVLLPWVLSPNVITCQVFRAKSGTQFVVFDMFYFQDNLRCQVWRFIFWDLELLMSHKFSFGEIVFSEIYKMWWFLIKLKIGEILV